MFSGSCLRAEYKRLLCVERFVGSEINIVSCKASNFGLPTPCRWGHGCQCHCRLVFVARPRLGSCCHGSMPMDAGSVWFSSCLPTCLIRLTMYMFLKLFFYICKTINRDPRKTKLNILEHGNGLDALPSPGMVAIPFWFSHSFLGSLLATR